MGVPPWKPRWKWIIHLRATCRWWTRSAPADINWHHGWALLKVSLMTIPINIMVSTPIPWFSTARTKCDLWNPWYWHPMAYGACVIYGWGTRNLARGQLRSPTPTSWTDPTSQRIWTAMRNHENAAPKHNWCMCHPWQHHRGWIRLLCVLTCDPVDRFQHIRMFIWGADASSCFCLQWWK